MNFFDSWQTPAALAIVFATALIFAIRIVIRRKSGKNPGCSDGCGCSLKPQTKQKS